MNYKVSYIAKDGTNRFFTFESDHRIVSGKRINLSGNPLLCDVFAQFRERNSNPKSAMAKHGGSKKLTRITNIDTGYAMVCDLYV